MSLDTQALHRLTTVNEVETIIGRPPAVVLAKELDHLDAGCTEILAHSPIAGIGYLTGPDARPVTTYIGGAAGFAEILNPNTIAIPVPDGYDPPQPNAGISFVFLLPGVGEVLRLNGRVLRSGSSVEISVEQAFVHCAKAIHRSRLWLAPNTNDVVDSTNEPGGPTTLTDPMVASMFAACPFLVVSTWAGDLSSDTSPRGDNPGFVQILDANTIAIPDRKGNKRADTFHNLVENDQIALAVLVPGLDTVLHLRGTAYMSDEPELLATMELKGASPHAALVIKVTHVELRDNTAIRKSDIWHLPSDAADKMPNMMALASQHVVIMSNRAQGRSALGAAFGLLAKYPRLAKAVADLTYKSELKGEGYPGPGSPSELGSPIVIGDDHNRSGRFSRLLARLQLTGRNATGTGTGTAIGLRDVKVVDVIRETSSTTTLVLEDPARATFDFKAGQFFTISARIGKHTVRRAYSASCAPGGQRLAVTVKQVTGGSFSTHLNTKIKAGKRLQILGPSGSFCIPDPSSAPKELILIAAGSGITPIMSILRTMMTETTDSRVMLIYGNRTESDIIFADALAELCATYPDRLVVRHVLSKPPPAWTGAAGRLDQHVLQRELSALACPPNTHYYICGPEGVMDGARGVLIDRGVEESRIHRERFVRAVDELNVVGFTPQTMAVVDSGSEQLASVEVKPGTSLLQAGLAAGLSMPYSCTVGNCGDCMVKLIEGEVAMGEPNCLSPEQRADGFILTCIGQPRSAVRIEIGDE